MTNLKQEIQQKEPFSSLEEEVFLNLLRSADCLRRVFQQKTHAWGLTRDWPRAYPEKSAHPPGGDILGNLRRMYLVIFPYTVPHTARR